MVSWLCSFQVCLASFMVCLSIGGGHYIDHVLNQQRIVFLNIATNCKQSRIAVTMYCTQIDCTLMVKQSTNKSNNPMINHAHTKLTLKQYAHPCMDTWINHWIIRLVACSILSTSLTVMWKFLITKPYRNSSPFGPNNLTSKCWNT